VIDERLDLDLLGSIAERRPEWQVVMVGPVVKIDEAELPRAPNLHYLGGRPYAELPRYLAGWDVALMPFARNEATRFISPTKTPEYLAAGAPVVSTSIRDVVRPYGDLGLVRIADAPDDFVAAIEAALVEDPGRGGRRPTRSSATSPGTRPGRGCGPGGRGRPRARRDRAARPHAPSGSPRPSRDRAARPPPCSAGPRRASAAKRRGPAGGRGRRGPGRRLPAAERRPWLRPPLRLPGGRRRLRRQRRGRAARPRGGQRCWWSIGGRTSPATPSTATNDDGILIHQYGPHIFHTNARRVFDYLSRFTEWRPYEHRVLASVDGKLVPIPINRTTVNALYGLDLRTTRRSRPSTRRGPSRWSRGETSEDVVVGRVGRDLYEKFFQGYTRKQWGLDPSELDAR
jgi:UDP-galactopyranose mutase